MKICEYSMCIYLWKKLWKYANIWEYIWKQMTGCRIWKQNLMFTNWNSGSSSFIAHSYYSVITENGSSFKLCSY